MPRCVRSSRCCAVVASAVLVVSVAGCDAGRGAEADRRIERDPTTTLVVSPAPPPSSTATPPTPPPTSAAVPPSGADISSELAALDQDLAELDAVLGEFDQMTATTEGDPAR